MLEDEEIDAWIERYHTESGPFRDRVDAALRDADEEMWLHAQQVAKEEAEAKERDKQLAQGLESGLQGMIGEVEGAGAGSIADDLAANVAVLTDAEAATRAADDAKLKTLEEQGDRFAGPVQAALEAGKSALDNQRVASRGDQAKEDKMVQTLRDMVNSQDDAIASDRSRLQDQARKLN